MTPVHLFSHNQPHSKPNLHHDTPVDLFLPNHTTVEGIKGLYLHGMFTSDSFRSAWLEELGAPNAAFAYDTAIETTLDDLAKHLEAHVDIDALLDIARQR